MLEPQTEVLISLPMRNTHEAVEIQTKTECIRKDDIVEQLI